MKSVFIDTNVLVDLLGDRKPFSKHAIEIFGLAESEKIQLYTSSHSIATTYYLLKKYTEENELRKIIYEMLDYLKVIGVDEVMIKHALKSSVKDFEDGIQLMAATSNRKIDAIVTRNPKDFKGSTIKVLTPDNFLAEY